MSRYQVQQCLFDYLRAVENAPKGEKPPISLEGYDLSDEEKQALLDGDVEKFYAFGTHPVIINGYCRAQGYKRADYRPLFGDHAVVETRRTRWQTS